MSTPRRSLSRRSPPCATARPSSCRRTGRRPISSGWRTSSPGACRASSGGDTRSPPGTRPGAASCRGDGGGGLRRGARRRRRARRLTRRRGAGARRRSGAARRDLQARRGRPRHLVLLGAVAVLDPRLAGRDAGTERYYPTDVLVTGFDIIFFWVARMMMMGLHFQKRDPVPRRLYPRPRARREGREDVEVEGQRHRPDRPHRPLRRRRVALHPGRHGGAGPRHQALAKRGSKATAISRPSSGTPRASPR